METKTFTEKVRMHLQEQGRSNKWLAKQIGVHQCSFSTKLTNNTFSISEVFYISHLLNIKE